MGSKANAIRSFGLEPGDILADKYVVEDRLGAGWEGEVYLLTERRTGIERAGKLWFPQRNIRNRAAIFYAKKLHKLRHCPILIQYHTHETVELHDQPVTLLVSDFVEGEILSQFLARHPGKRLTVFEALHLLYGLAVGLESIHHLGEYHGDLHTENVIIKRSGISFELKLLDMFQWGAARQVNIHDDVVELVRIFYEAVGGQRHYARQPPVVKDIVRGMKRSLILSHHRTAGHLREYLETMEWD